MGSDPFCCTLRCNKRGLTPSVALRPLPDFHQLPRERGEALVPVRPHGPQILDPDPVAAGHVDARLDRDRHALGELALRVEPQRRRLVDVEPDAVAEAVTEELATA